MLDLSFGLPIAIRDAALKLVSQGPSSSINREYFAQNHEGELTDGQIPEEYEKTDQAARELLRKLARSEPYYKRRRVDNAGEGSSSGGGPNGIGASNTSRGGGPGPIRTGGRGGTRGSGGGAASKGAGQGRRQFPSASQLPPGPQDIAPPADQTITSLFLTGVEDDLAEHSIRTFFSAFGQIRSIVCVHRSRAAFVNFASRAGAEAAAESCQGRAVGMFPNAQIFIILNHGLLTMRVLVAGCPLRIQWGRPRPLGNIDRTQAAQIGKELQTHIQSTEAASADSEAPQGSAADQQMRMQDLDNLLMPPPTHEGGQKYPSQAIG